MVAVPNVCVSCYLTIQKPSSHLRDSGSRPDGTSVSGAHHDHDQRKNNMTHKFKIGETVIFRPRGRSARAEEGTFTIIGFAPGSRDEPIYRLKHLEKEL
jgi:hypothetical protein